jgi:putative tricarboxylic transport membrane protein
MGTVDGLLSGFAVALQPTNLLFVLVGVLIGMFVGVLPGLGPTATIALLLPLTFGFEPATGIIMLAGIYYGSMYGGTITSVLLRLPGEPSSVITTIDGYEMTKRGRSGPALGIAAIGSFVGGIVATAGIVLLAPQLAGVALRFGPPEFAAVALLGLLLVAYLGTGSLPRSLAMAGLGLLLATIGQDPVTGSQRFTFGSVELLGGLEFTAIAMGLFGIGEILYALQRAPAPTPQIPPVRHVWPTRDDFGRTRGSIARGSIIGFAVGLLPGGGGIVSPLAAYGVEKRLARDPKRFGSGAIEGVAAPETANNAGSTAAFVPLLTLGIPPNAVLALIFGALLIHGITPGPQLISDNPDLFWGVVVSMLVGNVILLVLNIPLIGVFVRALRVRMGILGPLTVVVTLIGVYSINSNPADMLIAVIFGLLGYAMRKTGFEPAPLVLAFLLGTIMERSARQALLLSDGSPSIFLTRPISAVLLIATTGVVVFAAWRAVQRRRLSSRATADRGPVTG